MTDIVERLRNQLNAANRLGLSISGDPAWAIEQCNRAHARTHLNEKVDEWLPELLTEIASLRAELERAKIYGEEGFQVDSEIISKLRAERDAQADTIATLQAKLDKAVANNDVALATAYQCGHEAGEEAGIKLQRERDAVIARTYGGDAGKAISAKIEDQP